MIPLFKVIRAFLFLFLGCLFLGIIGAFSLYFYYSHDLPKLDSLADYNPPIVSEVFDTHGAKIGEFWSQKRILIPAKEMPKTMVQAIVASEDDRFFKHGGIDYWGILRAFFENLKAGHVVQGGSTITQQVTKSLLLTSERTLSRKVKEAILATRLEKKFSKDEILYLYLNQTFFGNRAYGIEAAAENYFHKTAKELNIAEAAMIAGLAKAPSTYSPISNPSQAKQRQEYVIERMYDVGFITKEQAKEAKAVRLKIWRAGTDKEANAQWAPWYTEHIRRLIQKNYGEQVPYTHGLKIETSADLEMQKAADLAVDRGLRELDKREGYQGPILKLNADSIQEFADKQHKKIITDKLDKEGDFAYPPTKDIFDAPTPLTDTDYYQAVITKVNAQAQNLEILVGHVPGIISMVDYTWARKRDLNSSGYTGASYVRDPSGVFHEGDVILVKKKSGAEPETHFSLEQTPEVEGAMFSYEPDTGFVRAIVGGRNFNESGEFNRAMQATRQTGSAIKPLIYAAALDKGYTPATIIEDAPIYYEYTPGKFWSPQNYGGGFKGPTSFRSGLVNSRNVVTVRILMDINCDYVAALARKLGITTPIQRYYSMALGSNDMKLYELSRAYGTFVNGGILPDLVFIKKITDRFGRVLEEYTPRTIVPFAKQLEAQGDKPAALPNDKEAKVGFRNDLMKDGQAWIDADKLKLTEVEKRILYGKYIPEGYAMSPRTAYTMVSLMNDVVNFGTGFKVKELKRPAAGKTGTTNDETDVWFVGYVPSLFAGVWVGFDQVHKIGGHETGGGTAAPIFLYYMQQVLKDKPVEQFNIPAEINQSALDAPIDTSLGEDAESGGTPKGTGKGADFFMYDF